MGIRCKVAAGFLLAILLAAPVGICRAAAAQEGGSGYDGSRALSIWRLSKRTQQQIQMDYIARLKSELDLKPGDVAIETELGRSYFWMGLDQNGPALAEAKKCFEDVLSRDPDNAAALAFHGSLLGFQIGNKLVSDDDIRSVGTRAMAELDRGVTLAPQSLEVRFMRAYADLYTPSVVGRNAQGVDDFKFIIERIQAGFGENEGLAEAYVGLGDLYNKMGRRGEATAAWRHAAESVPGSDYATVAAARLGITPKDWGAVGPGDALQLAAFFCFLVGLAIFGILAGRLLSSLLQTRRNRGRIAASLAVTLIVFAWNAVNLLAISLASIEGVAPKALTNIIGDNHGELYLILALSPIPFGLFLAYRFHKAAFMDVILKRGAALLMLLALAVINAHIWADVVTFSSFKVMNSTLRPAIFIGIWLSLFMLYLPLRGKVYSLVDRYLLRRRDYSNLMGSLIDRTRAVTEEEGLKRVVSDVFKDAFAAEFVRFLSPETDLSGKVIAELERQGSDILLTRDVFGDDLYHELDGRLVEVVLPIKSPDRLHGILMFGPRAYGQGYLSEELKLLRAVAGHVAPLLENTHLQVVRRQQAIAEQELRKLATQAELKALRAQIDPHFFFNALNSVASLISEDPVAAEELVENLGELFRSAFKPNRDFTTIGQEVELIETYLKVEQARFGDKLVFESRVDPAALGIKIPSLTIQPLIENSVKHGISKSTPRGVITLVVSIEREGLAVCVSDTGAGIAPHDLPDLFSRGVGLSNVDSRLVGLYGPDARLNVQSEPGCGASVSFIIPLVRAQSDQPAEIRHV